jgi:RNA ligase
MKDPILYKNLLKEVEAKRVTVSTEGDLQIFKYTQDTHIEGQWNDVNRQARGLIMRTDGTIVARPFPKFFNLGEVSETKLDNLPWHESAEVFEKLDGSCGIGFLDNGVWRLATPGSLSSDQAISGTCMLYNAPGYNLSALPTDCTPVFEIVYPGNRIVCDYTKDPRGSQFLALLAIIEHGGKEWHQARVDQIAAKCGFPRPKRYSLDLRSSDIPFNDNEEGYVVLFEGGLRVKIKSPAYLRVHRLLNYLSPKGVIELMRGKEYGVTLRELPPSIARDFDDIRAAVQAQFDSLKSDANCHLYKLHIAVGEDAARKDKALWIQANVTPALRGLVFALLDAKDIEDGLWRLVLKGLEDEATIPTVD